MKLSPPHPLRRSSGTIARQVASIPLMALACSLLMPVSEADAALIFSEDFNGFFGGNQNSLQFQSGLKVSFGGNLTGWDKTGGGVVHAVDKNGTGDYAAMIWQDNVITQSAGIPANTSAQTYTVSFVGGPAVYAAPGQVTAASDGMVIDILRGDDSVLATFTYMPGAWAGAQTFAAAGFTYTGDGSGPVPGDGTVKTTNDSDSDPRNFYRIRRLP